MLNVFNYDISRAVCWYLPAWLEHLHSCFDLLRAQPRRRKCNIFVGLQRMQGGCTGGGSRSAYMEEIDRRGSTINQLFRFLSVMLLASWCQRDRRRRVGSRGTREGYLRGMYIRRMYPCPVASETIWVVVGVAWLKVNRE